MRECDTRCARVRHTGGDQGPPVTAGERDNQLMVMRTASCRTRDVRHQAASGICQMWNHFGPFSGFHRHVLVLITLAQEEEPPPPDSMVLHSIARHDAALLTRTYEVTSTPTIPRLSSHYLGSHIHIFTSKLFKTRPRSSTSRLHLFKSSNSLFLCG